MKITIESLTEKIEGIKKHREYIPYHPEFVGGLLYAYEDVLDCLIDEAREQMNDESWQLAQDFMEKFNS
jgi:hypothetical protein